MDTEIRTPRLALFVGWLLIVERVPHILSTITGFIWDYVIQVSGTLPRLPGVIIHPYPDAAFRGINLMISLLLAIAGVGLLCRTRWARRFAMVMLLLACTYEISHFLVRLHAWSDLISIGMIILLFTLAGYAVLLLALEWPTVRAAWQEVGGNRLTAWVADFSTKLPVGWPPVFALIAMLLLIEGGPVLFVGLPRLPMLLATPVHSLLFQNIQHAHARDILSQSTLFTLIYALGIIGAGLTLLCRGRLGHIAAMIFLAGLIAYEALLFVYYAQTTGVLQHELYRYRSIPEVALFSMIFRSLKIAGDIFLPLLMIYFLRIPPDPTPMKQMEVVPE